MHKKKEETLETQNRIVSIKREIFSKYFNNGHKILKSSESQKQNVKNYLNIVNNCLCAMNLYI